jgi:hypothetical protein
MPISDLEDLWFCIQQHPRKEAKGLNVSVRDAKHIKNYAINRIMALSLKESERAGIYTQICDNIMQKMSPEIRWR